MGLGFRLFIWDLKPGSTSEETGTVRLKASRQLQELSDKPQQRPLWADPEHADRAFRASPGGTGRLQHLALTPIPHCQRLAPGGHLPFSCFLGCSWEQSGNIQWWHRKPSHREERPGCSRWEASSRLDLSTLAANSGAPQVLEQGTNTSLMTAWQS